jgi:hypothetical protein
MFSLKVFDFAAICGTVTLAATFCRSLRRSPAFLLGMARRTQRLKVVKRILTAL